VALQVACKKHNVHTELKNVQQVHEKQSIKHKIACTETAVCTSRTLMKKNVNKVRENTGSSRSSSLPHSITQHESNRCNTHSCVH